MKKYWIITISCLLGGCLYHLNSMTETLTWVVQNFYPSFNGRNFWDTFMATCSNILIITPFIMIKSLLKELARYKIAWARRYKVSKIIVNWAIIPYISFKIIYNPISYYGIDLNVIFKKIFIIIEVCLILIAIFLSINKDNELFLKE